MDANGTQSNLQIQCRSHSATNILCRGRTIKPKILRTETSPTAREKTWMDTSPETHRWHTSLPRHRHHAVPARLTEIHSTGWHRALPRMAKQKWEYKNGQWRWHVSTHQARARDGGGMHTMTERSWCAKAWCLVHYLSVIRRPGILLKEVFF